MKLNKRILGLLLGLICFGALFSSCTPGGGEVTTDVLTEPTPETSVVVDETTATETDEATGEATTETPPETTAPPSVFEAKVCVYDALGNAKEYIIKSTTLPSSALETIDLTVGEDRTAKLIGWEYSVEKDGKRLPYDTKEPPLVTFEGMHIYPVIEYSYRVRFFAGEGAFSDGASTEFYITDGENIKISELLKAMPTRADDYEYTYTLLGFMLDSKQISAADTVKVTAPLDFTAVYGKEELIYTVSLSTEFGELIGGGKEKTVTCNYLDAKKLIESYNSYTSEDVYLHDAMHEFTGISVANEGREWKVVLNWKHIDIRFTVTFDYGEGQTAVISQISAGGKVIIPTGERLADKEKYYDFVGWRDSAGQLYNGGYELTVNESMTLFAEYAPGERRVYTVTFDTEVGSFEDGSPILVLTGYYGDPIVPPTLTDVTFGEVVYKFTGWNAEIPADFGEDMAFTAVYVTEKPVYFINYYVDGDLYLTEHHYAGTPLTFPEAPETADGYIFCGWDGVPEMMPEVDLDIYSETRLPKVVYILDGDEVSSQSVKAGTVITLAAPAQKQGYTVSGWSTESIGELTDGGFIMPACDVIFNAFSSPNKHTVKYILDGVEIYSDCVNFGELYTVRGIEVRLGYDFSGWQIQNHDIEFPGGVFTVPDEDVVFFAESRKCSYKVNYYLEDELLYSDEYFFGDTVLLRPNEEQTGCTFAWSSAGVDITSGIFIMPAGDVDIYGAFSAGDNTMIFMIDGKEYGRIGAVSGQTVDLGMMPTKYGHTFSGWTCDEIDVSEGVFKMPEGDIVLRGSFVPNAHDIFFIDIASDVIINTSHLDYSARFSLVDRIYTAPGKVSDGWILLAGHALLDGDEYIMPDCDVIFGIVWENCLTLEIDEEYYIPYFALLTEEYGGLRYDEATRTVYISEPSIKAHGESNGVTVVYEYEVQ
ncbi:MAG: InlB B-repeat-containing protein [Clostridia bacterium]|nr:InlB B-repeat-containing protein [Clostridia bacterium]